MVTISISYGTIITNGPFELDGDAIPSTKDDWKTLVNGGGSAKSFSGIITDPSPQSIFTTGGSKDTNPISQWRYKNGNVPDKDQLLDAYAAVYTYNGQTYLYFGTDRYANNGDSTIGFWFFKNNVALAAGDTFTGAHSNGDLLILANFGSNYEVKIYQWNNGNLVLLYDNLSAKCTPGATQSACFIFNTQTTPSPWNYVPKFGTPQNFPAYSFTEGGIVLSDFFDDVPCFGSFLAESRSSHSLTAELKDFVLNSFNTCKLDIIINCIDTNIDETKTLFVYTYRITVRNSGAGKLYSISISYNGQQVDLVPQLLSGQEHFYIGQFKSPQSNPLTGVASVIAYADPALTIKLIGSANPDSCRPLNPLTSINPIINCNGVNVNGNTGQFEYSFSGLITNTGFGIETLQSVIVIFNGNQQVINLQGFILNPVIAPTSVNFNGIIVTNQVINGISLVVVSRNYLNVNSQYTTVMVQCPPPPTTITTTNAPTTTTTTIYNEPTTTTTTCIYEPTTTTTTCVDAPTTTTLGYVPTTITTPNLQRPTCYAKDICDIRVLRLDFGDLLKYNIFTYQNFINDNQNPSDVEGRVAVGGNHIVPTGHSIGDKLCNVSTNGVTCQNLVEVCCNGYDTNNLVVRGYSHWPDGRLYFGGACIGDLEDTIFLQPPANNVIYPCGLGKCMDVNGLLTGCRLTNNCVPQNSWWDQMWNKLKTISASLYGLSANGVTFWEASTTPDSPPGGEDYSSSPFIWTDHLWLQPLGNNIVNVFNIDASKLAQASSFFWAPESSCPSLLNQDSIGICLRHQPNTNNYIIINVHAGVNEDCSITNLNLEDLKPYANRLIWNFGQCKHNLNIQGVGLYGTIIAPDATLNAEGFINGQVFVKEFHGTSQINWYEFKCLQECLAYS